MLVTIAIAALVFAFIGGAVGQPKGIGGTGFVLGAILGPIGVLIVATMKRSVTDRIQARPVGEGWHPDPLGRFDSRWYDGTKWTQHVGRVDPDGSRRQLEDPT